MNPDALHHIYHNKAYVDIQYVKSTNFSFFLLFPPTPCPKEKNHRKEVGFRTKVFYLDPKNLDSVLGFASGLLCSLGQVSKLNHEDWWTAWAYKLGKTGSSWPDQGTCFKPLESTLPESETGFCNSHRKSILASKLFPGGEAALAVQERMQCSALAQSGWHRTWAVPFMAIAAPGHSYWGHGFPVLGGKAFLEVKFGVRREIT